MEAGRATGKDLALPKVKTTPEHPLASMRKMLAGLRMFQKTFHSLVVFDILSTSHGPGTTQWEGPAWTLCPPGSDGDSEIVLFRGLSVSPGASLLAGSLLCFPSASQRSAPRGSGLSPPLPPLLRHTRTGSLPESRALTTTCQRADPALHTSPERQTFQGCFLLHVPFWKCRWLVTCNVKTPGVAPCSPQAASGAPSPVCPSRIPSSHLEALQLSLTPGHPRHDHGVS